MAITQRDTALLVGGLVLGIAGAWALFGRGGEADRPAAATVQGSAPGRPAAGPPQLALSADLCDFDRTLPVAGEGDGQLALQKEAGGKGASGVRDLLVRGKEAAAAGHRRDAETAFLMACRAAGELDGADRILLADAMYRLGRHYAMVEPTSPAGKREALKQRSRDLYASSLQAYRATYGEDHEKTRFAVTGLAALGGAAAPVKTEAAKAEADPPVARLEPKAEPVRDVAKAEPKAVPKPAPRTEPTPRPARTETARVAPGPRPAPAPVPAAEVADTDAPPAVAAVTPRPAPRPAAPVARPVTPRAPEPLDEPLATAEGEAGIGQASGDVGDVGDASP